MSIEDEIAEVQARLEYLKGRQLSATCKEIGHRWELLGGCGCDCDDGRGCSLPVYVCARCGDCDYGHNEEANEIQSKCYEIRDWLRDD